MIRASTYRHWLLLVAGIVPMSCSSAIYAQAETHRPEIIRASAAQSEVPGKQKHCARQFAELSIPGDVKAFNSRPFAPETATNGNTYHIKAVTRDAKGHHRMVVQKDGAEWFNVPGHTFRGDPNWNFSLMGDKLANYFGFKRVSDSEIQLPAADTANQAIANLNKSSGHEIISLRFYTPKIDRVSKRDYLSEFAFNARHPIARNGDEAVHDINFHFAGIFLPPKVIDLVRGQAKALLEFEKFIAKQTHLSAEDRIFLANKIEEFSREIDAITAGPQMGINETVSNRLTPPSGAFHYWVTSRISDGASPADFLRRQFRSQNELKSLAETFVSEQGKVNPKILEPLGMSPSDIEKLTRERIEYFKSLVSGPSP